MQSILLNSRLWYTGSTSHSKRESCTNFTRNICQKHPPTSSTVKKNSYWNCRDDNFEKSLRMSANETILDDEAEIYDLINEVNASVNQVNSSIFPKTSLTITFNPTPAKCYQRYRGIREKV